MATIRARASRLFAYTVLSTFLAVTPACVGNVEETTFEEADENTAELAGGMAEGTSSYTEKAYEVAREGVNAFNGMMTKAADDLTDLTARGVSSVGSWVEGPALEQRRYECEQEDGEFAKIVEITPCIDGVCTVTVDGDAQEQACEGEASGDTLDHQCVHQASDGQYYFNDGPSVPHALQRAGSMLGDVTDFILWNSVFWEAAVNHDYCYHHGNATYDYNQVDCDAQFVDDLMALCTSSPQADAPWFDEDTCATNAHGMYAAVRACGSANFANMNTRVSYPKYEPMYKKLGLKKQPLRQDLRDTIDGVL